MATVPRIRVNLMPPGETVVFDNAADSIRRGSRFTLAKILAFAKRVVVEEPTLLAEIAAWGFIVSWSYSLLAHRTATLPDPIAQAFESGPYLKMAIIGAALASVQFVAMVSGNERARALCSFVAAIWLGGLATSLIAGDFRVPSGLGYVILSGLSLLAFWRVFPRFLVNILSGVAALLRRRT